MYRTPTRDACAAVVLCLGCLAIGGGIGYGISKKSEAQAEDQPVFRLPGSGLGLVAGPAEPDDDYRTVKAFRYETGHLKCAWFIRRATIVYWDGTRMSADTGKTVLYLRPPDKPTPGLKGAKPEDYPVLAFLRDDGTVEVARKCRDGWGVLPDPLEN